MAFGSQIHDVIIDGIKSKQGLNDPVVKEFVSQMKSESDALALATVTSAAEMLAKANSSNAPQSVIDAYERILTRASSR
jgi:hypothetical protein